MTHINAVSFTILIVLFVVVTGVGFAAARWRRAEDRLHLNEWGLGGRGFGTVITWFLLGGDLYTAYTFIAVRAVVFGAGAAGFFAVPYTVIVFPIVFVFAPRLWSVARVHNYVTPADFFRGRYGSAAWPSRWRSPASLPRCPTSPSNWWASRRCSRCSGSGPRLERLRQGPATDDRVPPPRGVHLRVGAAGPRPDRVHQGHADLRDDHRGHHLHPVRVGGWGHIFSVADTHLKTTNPKTGKPNGSLIEQPAGMWAYSTLALGSALALFMYPHAMTGVFAASGAT